MPSSSSGGAYYCDTQKIKQESEFEIYQVLFVSFFYSWSTFPASPRHRVNDGSGEKGARVEKGSQEGRGERTKQIDASGRPGNYREAPQNVDKNCNAYPFAPQGHPERIQCSSTPPAPSQTPQTVGHPLPYSYFREWCKFLKVNSFKTVCPGHFRHHLGQAETHGYSRRRQVLFIARRRTRTFAGFQE